MDGGPVGATHLGVEWTSTGTGAADSLTHLVCLLTHPVYLSQHAPVLSSPSVKDCFVQVLKHSLVLFPSVFLSWRNVSAVIVVVFGPVGQVSVFRACHAMACSPRQVVLLDSCSTRVHDSL